MIMATYLGHSVLKLGIFPVDSLGVVIPSCIHSKMESNLKFTDGKEAVTNTCMQVKHLSELEETKVNLH